MSSPSNDDRMSVPVNNKDFVRFATNLLSWPDKWVSHRYDTLQFGDDSRVRIRTRIDIDAGKVIKRSEFAELKHDGRAVAVPVGMFAKEMRTSASLETSSGAMLPALDVPTSLQLTSNAIFSMVSTAVGSAPDRAYKLWLATEKVVKSRPGVAEPARIQLERSEPEICRDIPTFANWLRYLSQNALVFAVYQVSDLEKPIVAIQERTEHAASPFRNADESVAVELGAPWWSEAYYLDIRPPVGLSLRKAKIWFYSKDFLSTVHDITQGDRSSLQEIARTPADRHGGVLFSRRLTAFRRNFVEISLAPTLNGAFCLLLAANALTILLLLAMTLYIGLSAEWGKNVTIGSVVSLLVFVPGLTSAIAVEKGEHQLLFRKLARLRLLIRNGVTGPKAIAI
ncbi:hypothetical protein [Frankia sp. Cj3]|uniref:hypothetical protein n=1 Tax=Frankia sp. Cj3 TaxID=2880976 RepID=UPI001EF62094|nr:hypothetical protein [Frankia sp. Cj3]